MQTPLAQSSGPPHTFVSAHLAHVPPPQSMSVSAPFFTASPQVGAEQTPPLQTPLTQSLARRQILPVPHLGQAPPPQSTSVSVPFFTPSEHEGVRQ